MIKGVIFDYQSPTAKNFGALFKMLGDCIVNGCVISGSGGAVTITPGMIVVGGRAIEITSAENITVSGTGYVRIICNVDMSGTATTSQFSQAYFTTETAAALSGFTDLTQDDVNMNGTLYQAEVAVFEIFANVISSKIRQMGGVFTNAINENNIADGAVGTSKFKADAVAPKAQKWSTARSFKIQDADGTNISVGVSVDGSGNVTLKLPSTIKANLSGNATSATSATNATNATNANYATSAGSATTVPNGTITRDKMSTLTLKSGVDYFASEAARNAAITNPVTGQITWIKV